MQNAYWAIFAWIFVKNLTYWNTWKVSSNRETFKAVLKEAAYCLQNIQLFMLYVESILKKQFRELCELDYIKKL